MDIEQEFEKFVEEDEAYGGTKKWKKGQNKMKKAGITLQKKDKFSGYVEEDEKEARTYLNKKDDDEDKKKRHFAFGGKKKEKHGKSGYRRGEEVEVDEAKSKLPPHLAKFFDKDGNLKKDAADRVAKGREKINWKDVTPKGYGPKDEEPAFCSTPGLSSSLKNQCTDAKAADREREAKKKKTAMQKASDKVGAGKMHNDYNPKLGEESMKNLQDTVKQIIGETNKKDKSEDGGDFCLAAAAAKKEGKTKFSFGGKEYPVTIKKDISMKNETNKNDKSDDGDGLDAVQPKAVKKKFKDRKDKDIDNDGDVDSSDKFLHKRRKAISKAVNKEQKTFSKMFTHIKSLIQNK